MLNWDTASTATKVSLLGALGLMGLGIILALVGASTQNKPLMFIALGLLGLGVITHLVGFGIRAAEQRRNIRSNHSGTGGKRPARKGRT